MGGGVAFPRTVWERLKEASRRRTSAVNEFVLGYRTPLRNFIVRCGVPERDADDLLQDVFMKLFERRLLDVADEHKGRFRSFLLGVTKNVVGNWMKKNRADKRSAAAVLSLDETEEPAAEHPARDAAFDRIWMEHLVRRAMDRLKAECHRKGLPYYEALSRHLADPPASYGAIAADLGTTEAQVTNYLHRGRKKLVEMIRAEISQYCSSVDEFMDELKTLSGFIERQP
jgi:RNA polymerase sigma-70 factor (ECF subfamily)